MTFSLFQTASHSSAGVDVSEFSTEPQVDFSGVSLARYAGEILNRRKHTYSPALDAKPRSRANAATDWRGQRPLTVVPRNHAEFPWFRLANPHIRHHFINFGPIFHPRKFPWWSDVRRCRLLYCRITTLARPVLMSACNRPLRCTGMSRLARNIQTIISYAVWLPPSVL